MIIRSSCIDCFAHLAAVCETLCQTGHAHTELDALCESALERLSELAPDMRTEEYTRLDLLLGVCSILRQSNYNTADGEHHL